MLFNKINNTMYKSDLSLLIIPLKYHVNQYTLNNKGTEKLNENHILTRGT